MKTPIAILNLWHQGAKTLVSIGGVGFALLLVFMQLGFMGAVSYTATNVLEKLEFDILLRPTDYLHLYEASNFEREWLDISRNTPGVAAAEPFWIMIQNWRKMPNGQELAELNAENQEEVSFQGQYLPVAVMAFEPQASLFKTELIPGLPEKIDNLHRHDVLLLDDSTKSDYGPIDGKTFTAEDVELSIDPNSPERRPEIGGAEFEIAGLFELGTGLAANAAVIMGKPAFERIYPLNIENNTSLGLLRLEDPNKIDEVVAELRGRLSVGANLESGSATAVEILTYEEALQSERSRWLKDTPIGLIFQMGVGISLLVGAAIVYMVLSTDVSNRLPEYATLLAMGYSRTYLVGIVMTQAMVLCAMGYLSAWIGAELLYRVTTTFSGIPLTMDLWKIVTVAVLGILMCVVSAILALRKLWKAEPANLF